MIQNNQKFVFRTAIVLFIIASILVPLLASPEKQILIHVFLALMMTDTLIRMHSGKKVVSISIRDGQSIEIQYFVRPFVKSVKSFLLPELAWKRKKELVGQLARADKIIATDAKGQVVFVISTELRLWSEEQLDRIETSLKAVGVLIKKD